jgi:hypothetical protein
MNKVEKVTSWEIGEGHTITKTLTSDSTYAMYSSSKNNYEWNTHITCSCGWVSGHNSKLSNKVIEQVHNEQFNMVLEVQS